MLSERDRRSLMRRANMGTGPSAVVMTMAALGALAMAAFSTYSVYVLAEHFGFRYGHIVEFWAAGYAPETGYPGWYVNACSWFTRSLIYLGLAAFLLLTSWHWRREALATRKTILLLQMHGAWDDGDGTGSAAGPRSGAGGPGGGAGARTEEDFWDEGGRPVG